MKIYLVSSGEYSDYSIDAAFSTRAFAEEYINGDDHYSIEEWDVDNRSVRIQEYWFCSIALRNLKAGEGMYDSPAMLDGTIFGESWIRSPEYRHTQEAPLGKRSDPPYELNNKTAVFIERSGVMSVKSFVSPDHCMKLAVEARQKWLRYKAQKAGMD